MVVLSGERFDTLAEVGKVGRGHLAVLGAPGEPVVFVDEAGEETGQVVGGSA